MPIPFLLGAAGVAAGIIGAGGHISAKETNEHAQKVSEQAQELYNNAKRSLEQAQNKTEKELLKLGYNKKDILDTTMQQFLQSYDKVKQIQVTESVGINEISKFSIDQQGAMEIKKMADIYSSSIKSGATGAAAGTVVALAASGSLTLVTGELATAGGALLAGNITAASGIAGSALSFGAAMTPLAAIAAPVVLFTGISAGIKADENLDKANVMYAEAKAASSKMKVSETLCNAITEKSVMYNELLCDLNGMFTECSNLLAGVIKKKEGNFIKKKLTSQDFSEEDLKLIAVTRALAGAVKAVIDTPILSNEGHISSEGENIYEQTAQKLPDFGQAVREIEKIDYEVQPIPAKKIVKKTKRSKSNTKNTKKKTTSDSNTILYYSRCFLGLVLGSFLATILSSSIAELVTSGDEKFLFMQALTANKIAVWLFICSIVVMLVGNIKSEIVERGCQVATGIALFIFCIQYCRIIEQCRHYIIMSIICGILLVAIGLGICWLEEKISNKEFFNRVVVTMVGNVAICLGYLILGRGIGLFTKFWWIVFVGMSAVGSICGMVDDSIFY